MKIALTGASGFVGSAILKEALYKGHHVTAIVRHPEKITQAHKLLTAVKADVMETGALAAILSGNDIVISAYNPGWINPNIYADFLQGATSIQEATKTAGVKRLLVVGGAGSLFIAPGLQLVDTPQFPAEWKPGALAARDYLDMLKREKQLDWTFLSPAIEMNPSTSGSRKGIYRTGLEEPVFDSHGKSVISVEDLAVAIIDEAEQAKHLQQRFTVGY